MALDRYLRLRAASIPDEYIKLDKHSIKQYVNDNLDDNILHTLGYHSKEGALKRLDALLDEHNLVKELRECRRIGTLHKIAAAPKTFAIMDRDPNHVCEISRWVSASPTMPNLPPVVQHKILSFVQNILEHACF
jgi:hypothetical protein